MRHPINKNSQMVGGPLASPSILIKNIKVAMPCNGAPSLFNKQYKSGDALRFDKKYKGGDTL